MATPSLAMIPSAYADSKVYSVLPNNGDGDFTFNRDSSATRVGQNGLIQTVGFFGNDLVTNGSFATNSDWTLETGWTISGGTANFSGGTGNKAMYQAVGITNGKTYKIQYTVSSISAGQVAVRFGGMSGVDEITATIIGTYTGYITATGSANGNIHIEDNDNNFVGSIDNISVQEVLGDQPRLNYDISNGVVQSCPSLLLEPASTNLLTYSQDFTQWATNATITPNAAISPDGTQNATLFSHSGGSFPQVALSGITFVSGADYVPSLYVKSDGTTQVQHSLLVNNVVVNFTPTNEWVRISDLIVSPDTSGSFVIAQNSGSAVAASFYIWGAQLEAGSYATSYIPTSGSSQTRAAETCDDAGNAATFNSTEGVLYVEISALANDQTNRRITLSDGSNNNRIVTGYNTTSNQIFYFVVVGSSTVASGNYTSSDITQFSKIAIKFKVNDFALWVDGIERQTDTSGAIFSANTLSSLQFEQGSGGALFFYGNTKDIRVYNEALTDAQLQTLTTL